MLDNQTIILFNRKNYLIYFKGNYFFCEIKI